MMKVKAFFAVLALFAVTNVFANTLVLLQPPPSPSSFLFGHSVGCYVTGVALDNNFAGVCKYTGYKNATGESAIVEWTETGEPLFIQLCHVVGQTINYGAVACPVNKLGPITTFSDADSYYEVFVKVVVGDVSAGILDSYPRVPVLVKEQN